MEKENKYELFDLLIFLYSKKKSVILVTILGAVVSLVVALLIPPLYKSTVVLYSSVIGSNSKTMLKDWGGYDLLEFGEETKTEHILQVLESNNLKMKLIEKFDLYSHYEIEEDYVYAQTAVLEEISSNISFQKTKFDAIQVTVHDENPVVSANIANAIATLLDSILYETYYQRTMTTYNHLQLQHDDILNRINSLEDSLNVYRKLGVFDYNLEVERYSEALAKGYANNTMTAANRAMLDQKFALLSEYGGTYNKLKDFVAMEKGKLSQVRDRILDIKANLNTKFKLSFTIEDAIVSDKKDKPMRSLIILLGTLGTFSMAVFTLLFIEFLRNFRKKFAENTNLSSTK